MKSASYIVPEIMAASGLLDRANQDHQPARSLPEQLLTEGLIGALLHPPADQNTATE